MTPAYVIVAEQGIFLGVTYVEGQSTGVWSQVGIHTFLPPHAVAFESAEVAMRFADRFDPPPSGLVLVPLQADIEAHGALFASREQCEEAGLMSWMLHDDDCDNLLPC